MISKPWDDSDIVDISDDLDEELREIFADMEAVLGKAKTPAIQQASSTPADNFITLQPEGQPDHWPRDQVEINKNIGSFDEDEPAEVEFLPDDFELPVLAEDSKHPVNGLSPAAPLSAKNEEAFYSPTNQADRLGALRNFSNEFSYADSVAELRPDDFFRLIEQAVITGLSRALKKAGR